MQSLVYILSIILRFTKDDSGSVAAEYSFLITFIAIVATLGMVALGPSIADFFFEVGDAIPDTQASPPCPLGGCP